MNMLSCILFILLVFFDNQIDSSSLREERKNHVGLELTDGQLSVISQLSDTTHFEKTLDSILIPRVVGTSGHEKVRKFIIQSMEELGWHVETDTFTADTPIFGPLEFENIITALNPNARRFLVLACHYDSKYFREGEFLGATDSAVPCAMMINLAYAMRKQLDTFKSNGDVSLKFIFFDGEEAFHRWGPDDSIYGAKHLAERWEATRYPKNAADGTVELHRLDMLVLLDLLGAPDPVFYSYFPNTEGWYRLIANTEERLAAQGHLRRYSTGKPEQRYFRLMSSRSGVEDDHIPFLQRGVPILHVIPHRFPDVWHTYHDNRNAIDFTTVDNLNKILRTFVAGYLRLSV